MKKSIMLVAAGLLVAAIGFTFLKPKEAVKEILPANGVVGDKNTVVFLGDSITAGYGVESEQAFPYLIGEYWKSNNILFRSVNEGISGDTTSGVLERLDNILTDNVYMVFLEIGANDAFAKTDIKEIKNNLKTIIGRIEGRGIKVAIMAMDLPGVAYLTDSDYVKNFAAIYDEVGKECGIPVMPSLVKDNENRSDIWQEDKIHPSQKGQALLASNALKFLNKNWVLEVDMRTVENTDAQNYHFVFEVLH